MGKEGKAPVKRGRPSKSSIPKKCEEGEKSESKVKCLFCKRVFPRNKSLQAHIRTHTNEKSYLCDYPSCGLKFTQSGQLRTHIRRHTCEKPYVCPAEGCNVRFKHPNRQCPEHPSLKLKRDGEGTCRTDLENLSENEVHWLKKYEEKKSAKNIISKKRPIRKRICSSSNSDELSNQSLSTINSNRVEMNTSGYGSLSSTQSSPDHQVLVDSNEIDYNKVPQQYSHYRPDKLLIAQILVSMRSGKF